MVDREKVARVEHAHESHRQKAEDDENTDNIEQAEFFPHRSQSCFHVSCLMPGLSRGLLALRDFRVTTSFALPEWKRTRRVSARLVNRAIRGNDLAATARTNAPARRLSFYVERERIVVSHPCPCTSAARQRASRRSIPAESTTPARRYSGRALASDRSSARSLSCCGST